MNRMLLTTAMSAVLAIAAPGVASAHNAKRHHRAHHHHAKRATVRTFGSPLPSAGAGSTTSTPVTPAPDSGATAGTVTSFTGGVLTITLSNGTTVSGQVTEQTEIHCLPATPPPPVEGEDRGDDEGGSASGDTGPSMSGHGDGVSHSDSGSSGGGGGEDGEGMGGPGEGDQSCTTAALVAGAVVREAELSVSSAGAVWDHVNLIG
jgi:hypothetical protein